jgi:hypothetical protein
MRAGNMLGSLYKRTPSIPFQRAAPEFLPFSEFFQLKTPQHFHIYADPQALMIFE